MGFKTIERVVARSSAVTDVRFAIVKTPNGHSGRVKIPGTLVKALGWTDELRFEVAAGTDEDLGWFKLTPAPEEKHRAMLTIEKSGLGVYSSSTLVPEGFTERFGNEGRVYTMEPQVQVLEDEKALLIYIGTNDQLAASVTTVAKPRVAKAANDNAASEGTAVA